MSEQSVCVRYLSEEKVKCSIQCSKYGTRYMNGISKKIKQFLKQNDYPHHQSKKSIFSRNGINLEYARAVGMCLVFVTRAGWPWRLAMSQSTAKKKVAIHRYTASFFRITQIYRNIHIPLCIP